MDFYLLLAIRLIRVALFQQLAWSCITFDARCTLSATGLVLHDRHSHIPSPVRHRACTAFLSIGQCSTTAATAVPLHTSPGHHDTIVSAQLWGRAHQLHACLLSHSSQAGSEGLVACHPPSHYQALQVRVGFLGPGTCPLTAFCQVGDGHLLERSCQVSPHLQVHSSMHMSDSYLDAALRAAVLLRCHLVIILIVSWRLQPNAVIVEPVIAVVA